MCLSTYSFYKKRVSGKNVIWSRTVRLAQRVRPTWFCTVKLSVIGTWKQNKGKCRVHRDRPCIHLCLQLFSFLHTPRLQSQDPFPLWSVFYPRWTSPNVRRFTLVKPISIDFYKGIPYSITNKYILWLTPTHTQMHTHLRTHGRRSRWGYFGKLDKYLG